MSLSHPDHNEYRHLVGPQILDKASQTLIGILQGITIDERLNAAEIAELKNWCDERSQYRTRSPFSEVCDKLDEIMADGVIDPDEQEDLLWLCKNLSADSEYFDAVTNEMQLLQGILHGVLADGKVSVEEAKNLQNWLNEHDGLKGSYPFDEIESILIEVLRDGEIDKNEQRILQSFLGEFVDFSFVRKYSDERQRIRSKLSKLSKDLTVTGICATCPQIAFEGKTFVFTGASREGKEEKLAEQVERLNGRAKKGLCRKTDFLVIGDSGNPSWAFSCYGRKVEEAVSMRREGHPILIIHESDFWDAIEDYT